MKIIGITGVFGSGKSTVTGFLKELGAAVIDADAVVHALYKPEGEGTRQVIILFGRGMIVEDGGINRRKLAQAVFTNEEALKKLNAVIHPLAARQVRTLLEEHRRRHTKVVILEAPLLIEAGWKGLVDEVWVTTAPREVICRRLNRKYGLSPAEVLARIRQQLPVSKQLKHATHAINTDTSLEHLKSKVQRLWQKTARK